MEAVTITIRGSSIPKFVLRHTVAVSLSSCTVYVSAVNSTVTSTGKQANEE